MLSGSFVCSRCWGQIKGFDFAVCRLASVLVWKWKAARADIFSNSVTALQLQLQEAIKNQKITNCWSDCPKTHIFTHKVVYGTSELKQKRPDTSWQDRNGALRQKQLVWLRNVCACECALSWQDKAKEMAGSKCKEGSTMQVKFSLLFWREGGGETTW